MALSWKMSGEAGFGITTIGYSFAKMVARYGLQIWSYAEYPSLIRGGFTTFELSIADLPYRTQKSELDFLICLRQDGYDRDKHRLHSESIVIHDKDTVIVDKSVGMNIPVPYKDIKAKHKAFQVMVNTVSIGVTFAVFGWDIGVFYEMIGEEFVRKGDEVIAFNRALAKEGWDYAQSYISENNLRTGIAKALDSRVPSLANCINGGLSSKSLVMTGNDAFALGSMIADMRAYCAYPMSPSSTVLSTLAAWSKKANLVVRHTEDEIAAINEALGFSFVGVRNAVGTSGGGFALMVEALSYAGIAELPIVTYLVQRPGPATGLPTWTGQGDLLFAVHAGHGEFMKVVLAPGDVEETIDLASKAFNIADVFQTPVIVMSDKLLGESHSSLSRDWVQKLSSDYRVDRGQIKESVETPYLRYKDTESGISDYLVPGSQPGIHWQANSYEHLEDSHTTEEAEETVKQVEKRARKVKTYLSSDYYCLPKIFGKIDSSEITFVSYGTNKHTILSAMDEMDALGIKTAYVHFTHLYPLDKVRVKEILDQSKRMVFVENGGIGQLAKLLLQEGCLTRSFESILKFDGRPILKSEIINYSTKK